MNPFHASPRPDRRAFLATLGGGLLAWPRDLAALGDRLDDAFGPPRPVGHGSDDRWQLVRDEFLIPPDRIYLNNGTLGPQPRVVVQAVMEYTQAVAQTFPPRIDREDLDERLEALLGGDRDGWVVTRNTTEAMNFVANGLEIGRGDDVLITDQEHIGGKCAWELVCARREATLRRARLPIPAPDAPVDAKDILEAIWAEVRPDTKVVAVSEVFFTNGAHLPVAELAARCRRAGVLFVVDAAHPPGLMPVDLAAIGPDFWVSSPHKWLCAPQGSGLLWMAPRFRDTLWPTLASGDWDGSGATRFNHMGTMDDSRVAGLVAAIEFHRSVGPERIHARAAELHDRLRDGLEAIPDLILRSPVRGSTAGMLSFEIPGVKSSDLQGHLARRANIRSRVIAEYDFGWMRLSTHLYNRDSDLDTTLGLLDEVARRGLPAG